MRREPSAVPAEPERLGSRGIDEGVVPVAGVHVEHEGLVGLVELQRPPHNFFDADMITEVASGFEALDADPGCRAIVLAAEGRSFCAGADFSGQRPDAGSFADGGRDAETGGIGAGSLYHEALRLFAIATPVVAAVHGPAIGGGLGLALVADFRVTCPEARWSANFARLGFHPGFALTATLPELVGGQQARRLFYTGARIDGREAAAIGLADECVDDASAVRARSLELAAEIAGSAPLVVRSIKRTLAGGRLDRLRAATDHELAEQVRLLATDDAREGIAAYAERRPPVFNAR
jgi:enoyl-CoA hydratase/carnithine racemase